MKLLYVTDAFAVYGGIERVLAVKMNYLAEHGFEVVLLTVNQGNHANPFSLHPSIKCIDLDVQGTTIAQLFVEGYLQVVNDTCVLTDAR